MKAPVVLIILDGWGYREETVHNAIAAAQTPTFDRLWAEHSRTLLEASGQFVGLPEGQMGNSEIGHTTIGAGKVIDTDLVRISKAAREGRFTANPVFQELFAHVQEHDSVLHVQGLVSPGGIHSHSEHLYAFLRAAKEAGVTKVAIHAFTDGRDTAPRSALAYFRELTRVLGEVGIGHISTLSGRFYAMDRDNNWNRLAKAEAAMLGEDGAIRCVTSPLEMLEAAYDEQKLDEHLEPMVFLDDQGQSYPIGQNDGVFVFNFRSDRVRMLTKRLLELQEERNLFLVTMTQYNSEFNVRVAFPPTEIETTLGAEVAKAGLRQVRIAETEKFPHATYFLNGGVNEPHEGEEHVLLASRKDVQTHDQAPEMRAEAIADAAIENLEKGTDFMFINFANPDMVGHTGKREAIVTALEEVDRQLARVAAKVEEVGGVALVTADHGNAEVNIDPVSGEMHTAHTINPVPFIMVGHDAELRTGSLADIAPTVLALLDVPVPATMTGSSLY